MKSSVPIGKQGYQQAGAIVPSDRALVGGPRHLSFRHGGRFGHGHAATSRNL